MTFAYFGAKTVKDCGFIIFVIIKYIQTKKV